VPHAGSSASSAKCQAPGVMTMCPSPPAANTGLLTGDSKAKSPPPNPTSHPYANPSQPPCPTGRVRRFGHPRPAGDVFRAKKHSYSTKGWQGSPFPGGGWKPPGAKCSGFLRPNWSLRGAQSATEELASARRARPPGCLIYEPLRALAGRAPTPALLYPPAAA